MEFTTSTPPETEPVAGPTCLYLGIKVQPGPIERHRLENFPLHNTVEALKHEAGTRAYVAPNSLELIHHGRILEDPAATLSGSGVREGEMVHVVLKKDTRAQPCSHNTDAELQSIVSSLRSFGFTPNAPDWTRAMQVLDNDERMEELLEAVPSLTDDCSALSILHEIELLAALATTLSTMRRGAAALPSLPPALAHLVKMLKAHPPPASSDPAPTSGFVYSLEALSEDDDGDDEDEDGTGGGAPAITREQLAAALRAAQQNSSSPGSNTRLLQLLQGRAGEGSGTPSTPAPAAGGSRNLITSDMFSSAVAEALTRAGVRGTSAAGTPMERSTTASSSQSPGATPNPENPEDFSIQLHRMHDMGLLDDAVNLRALLICNGDVNAAINFVFTSMEE